MMTVAARPPAQAWKRDDHDLAVSVGVDSDGDAVLSPAPDCRTSLAAEFEAMCVDVDVQAFSRHPPLQVAAEDGEAA